MYIQLTHLDVTCLLHVFLLHVSELLEHWGHCAIICPAHSFVICCAAARESESCIFIIAGRGRYEYVADEDDKGALHGNLIEESLEYLYMLGRIKSLSQPTNAGVGLTPDNMMPLHLIEPLMYLEEAAASGS